MNYRYHEDPEIYENYLLDRLSPEVRREFESHLLSCPHCRQELHLQRILISGIRETGKQTMKAEIRQQIQDRQLQPATVNWGIYLRMAAVVLFLVIAPGMIYYYWQILPEQQRELAQTPAEKFLPGQPDKIGQQAPTGGLSEEKGRMKIESEEISRGKDQDLSQVTNEVEGIEQKTVPAEKPVSASPVPSSARETDQEGAALDLVKKEYEELEKATGISAGKSSRQDEATRVSPVPGVYFAFDSSQLHFEKSTQELQLLGQSKSEAGQATEPGFWQFRQNTQTIQISLQQDSRVAARKKSTEFPEKFPVQLIQTDYPDLQMVWQLDTSQIKIDPRQIQILVDPANNLIVQLPSGIQYLIDTRKDSTEAVMITP